MGGPALKSRAGGPPVSDIAPGPFPVPRHMVGTGSFEQETKLQLLLKSYADRSICVWDSGLKGFLLFPGPGALSGIRGLSLVEPSPRGAGALPQKQSGPGKQAGGVWSQSLPQPRLPSWQGESRARQELERACESPRLRGAGLCGYRPGAPCPLWWRPWSWQG